MTARVFVDNFHADNAFSYYNVCMFADPVKNLRAFGLEENNIVADLGAGTGFYSIAAGKMAPRGKVYAIEINKDFLATIKSKVKGANLNNVEIIWGNIEKIGGTKIGDGIVDAIIASNVLHQVENKNKFIGEIKRILKPKGKMLLIDWSANSAITAFKMAIPKSKAREMFEKEDFIFEREINAGAYHYGMIFRLGSRD